MAAKGRGKATGSPKLEREPLEAKALQPRECSRYVRQKVAGELPAICETFLDKAKEGDATALKTLWQVGEMSPKPARRAKRSGSDADARGKAYAEAALRRFGAA